MQTPVKLLLILVPLLAPAAAADHAATCGSADGSVVPGVYAWLRPGCLGASVQGDCPIDRPLFHGEVVGVLGYADACSAGAWLP